jgi:hypothetical protein
MAVRRWTVAILLVGAIPAFALDVVEVHQVIARDYRVNFNGSLRVLGTLLSLLILLGGIVTCLALARRAYLRARLGVAMATTLAIAIITVVTAMVTEALLFGVAVI